MNARDKTPLRTLIADRLAAGEDTAAGIASAIGKGDTPSIVVKELNAMRTDGQVECEQRGKKKELVYWLSVLRDVAAATPSAAPVAADESPPNTSTRLDAAKDENYILIGLLADIRAAVGDPEGKLMQDELVEHIRAIYDLGEAHKRACLAWESAMMAAVGEDGVNDALEKIVDLQNKIRMQDAELFKQSGAVVELRNLLAEERTARMVLQEQVEELQREAMRGASLLSGSDRYTAAGYLVRASKRKPRTLLAEDKAREAALVSIRAGAQRAEVFALVPVGQARRGAEWRSA